LDASSDGGAGGSVHQSIALGGSIIFGPSIRLLFVKISVSNHIIRTLNDVGFSALSCSGRLGQVDQVIATQNTLDRLVNELRLMAVGRGEALAH
jgi:hypothetical protein